MKKQLQILDQSADDLVYCLYRGKVDVNELIVLTDQDKEINGIHVRAGIIGASHFLQVSCNDQCIATEVFACQQPSNLIRPYHCIRLQDFPCRTMTMLENDMIKFETDIVKMAWQQGYDSIVSYWDKEADIKDRYEFPGYKDACTIVMVFAIPHGIKAITFHSYPNQNTIVQTTTLFTKK